MFAFVFLFNRYAHSAGPKILKNRSEAQILLKNAIFDDFEIFDFFDFFGFFGRSENFGVQLWRCACGCQYDVRISQDSLDLIMMAYIFSPPLALPWKSCEKSSIDCLLIYRLFTHL